MLLPVSLIKNSINSFLNEKLSYCKDMETLYGRPVFYPGGNSPERNLLYLIDCSILTEPIQANNYPLLICSHMPDHFYNDTFVNLLVLKDEVNLTEVSNCLHQLFQQCEDWFQNLQILTSECDSLDELLTGSMPMFENPLNIMNNDFSIIASTTAFNEIFEQLDIPPFDSQGRLNPETVNCFKRDPLYNEVKSYEQPFIYPADILGARTLCGNIFWQKEYIARLVLIEAQIPFRQWDIYFFELLRNYVQKAFNQSYVNQSDNTLLNRIFCNMITGQDYSRTKLINALLSKSWSCNDTYCVVYLQPSTQDFNNNTLRYFVLEINENYPDCCSVNLKNNILIIANLKNYRNSVRVFVKDFTLFIREGNFRVGYSNPFTDIEYIAEHYKQAQIAYQYGTMINPTVWQHYFCDYAMEYILHKATEEISPCFLCAPGVVALNNYDKEKGSDYLHTLKQYLDCNQNTVRCAKALFIQRGTLLYRLEKIKNLTGMNLKDPQQLFYIQVSLKLLEADFLNNSRIVDVDFVANDIKRKTHNSEHSDDK